ncbi:sensor histidine kinase [Ferroacidibacillus organovorans]|uniref:histidine kinase n=1 Tax=Ferroacidibacillus organovorans TaxID=1765683 RepID=A0A101XT88_9BACL|nr:HAMP domain-containing sensor histidine kinase [Ferroacidibacillus organovorans]KUO97172.1 hypothetical protein ATW55_12760 [Ferroacidibacillus organovorans]
MKNQFTQSERRILSRILFSVSAWHLVAFLVFEFVLIIGTYYYVQNRTMSYAYEAVREEWEQKLHGMVETANAFPTSIRNAKVDIEPEPVATWIFSKEGFPLSEDLTLIGVTGNIAPLMADYARAYTPHTATQWSTTTFNKQPLLIGTRAIGKEGAFLVSAYSLAEIVHTLHALVAVDFTLALASLLIILPITYGLATHSLKPVRLAMLRQRHFVNDAAHELRTPMTLLRGILELEKESNDPKAMRAAIEEGLREVDYLSRIIGDLSTLARVGSNQPTLKFEPLELRKLVSEVIYALNAFAEENEVTVSIDAEDGTWTLYSDRVQLRQLLTILIENAIKYSRRKGHVKVRIGKKRNDLFVDVMDDGIGIPKEDLPRVFDRFYRSKGAEQHAIGSGIGLSIAAWIVSLLKGTITVSSIEGKGTTFHVTLPWRSIRRGFHSTYTK